MKPGNDHAPSFIPGWERLRCPVMNTASPRATGPSGTSSHLTSFEPSAIAITSSSRSSNAPTGERIRDKIAASKAKGMWMGGPLPLGYDVDNRLLVINELEAAIVRRIFEDFVTVRSATMMVRNYASEGVVTKSGKPFCKQTIYKMLYNRIFRGEIVHKGQSHPGQHQAIITQAQWDAAHALIASNPQGRRQDTKNRDKEPVLLRNLLFTPDGERLMPTYTIKKGKPYRYYTAGRDRRFGAWASRFGSLPAEPIEELVVAQVQDALSAPHVVQAVWGLFKTQHPGISEPEVVLPMRHLATMWPQLFPAEQCRLVQLLIERIVLGNTGMEIIWRDSGWQELACELIPGTIGAELAELEVTV